MFRKFRRLLNTKASAEYSGHPEDNGAEVGPSPASRRHRAGDSYFETLMQLQDAISKRDYENAASIARENVRQIPAWVREMHEEFGSFGISSLPALEQGGTMLAFVGDDAGLAEMRQLVGSVEDLDRWKAAVDQHEQDRGMFAQILEAISSNPNCLQSDVKDLVGAKDGRRVSILISYLEKGGKISRYKERKTYKLTLAGSKDSPDVPPKMPVGSHRTDEKSPPLREIDVLSLSYVPLPRSPLRWEETEAGRELADIPVANGFFEIRDADWQLVSIDKIPPDERPDTAFREMHPVDSGMLMIDDLGNAEKFSRSESSALRYNRSGHQVAEAGFPHGIYRLGVHPLGRGLIAMSKDCVAHAYDDDLQPIFQTALADTPEIEALLNRFDIQADQIKNHIRCVALSRDNARYLFTAVDEIWCVTVGGKGLWGAKLPIKEGWTRVATPSDRFGTSGEVEHALRLMNLNLPITPDDVKRRYRDLAKKWHPDLNPDNAEAEEKMKAINSAAEMLTGVDANTLPSYTGATFIQDTEPVEFVVDGVQFTVDLGFQVSEIHAADWIYAAGFAALSDSVYLAGYSGRVVYVDENGSGVRVYDIGSVPRRIIDTGDYLYILTDTRLYVLRDDAMLGLVDTFDGGDLVVAQTGFGLIEKKRFRWFREDGVYLGSVISKDPIRRVYSTSDGIVVESRQRRAVVRGVPAWWE